ncbi:MAG: DUF6240 domain-containing protein [Clostridiales bacterium]|jgi:hypothetical protein|nr:DUF6240 domain-containing protein [Clostridiales bacterium]
MRQISRPSSFKNRFAKDRIFKRLSDFATVPDARYGDSFANVRAKFGDLLLSLGLPSEPDDIRAAAILSRNEMDVNVLNITAVKDWDSQFRRLVDSLHPQITAHLIMEGKNPLDMPLSDIQTFVDTLEFYGDNIEHSLEENIMGLDRNLDKKIRSAIIGVYKALNLIGRHDGAAIGAVLRSAKSPTLGNFLDASLNYKNSFDVKVSDGWELWAVRDSIRDNIERGCELARLMLTT